MDRMNRRGFLECAAWTGAAVVWTLTGGVASSRLASPASAAETDAGTFSFVQISDTHVGFKGQANPDAAATLQQVIDRVNALPSRRRPGPRESPCRARPGPGSPVAVEGR